MALTPRQQRFVEEYLRDLNATAAYKRAGYRAKGRAAENNASRLLGNAGVRAAVEAARAERSRRTAITADRVLRELALVAFADVGEVLDFTGSDPRLRPARDIPRRARKALASVKVRRYAGGRGDEARDVEVIEFKFWDKLSALEKLGKHLGLFQEPPPSQTPVNVNVRFDLSRLTDEQLDELERLRAAAADAPG